MSPFKRQLLLVIFFLGYGLAYVVSMEFYFRTAHCAVMWLNNGLSLGILLLAGYRWWPALIALMSVEHLALALGFHRPLSFSLLATLANTLEPVICAWWIRRLLPDLANIFNFQGGLRVAGVVVAVTLPTSLIGAVAVISGYPGLNYWQEWWEWGLGNIVGTLLVLPVLIGWGRIDRQEWRALITPRSLLSIGGLWGATVLVARLAFGDVVSRFMLPTELPYLLVLMLLWAAIYVHPRVISGAMLLAALVLVADGVEGRGPFYRSGLPQPWITFNIQLYLALSSMISMIIAAITTERRKALNDLATSEGLYRGIVEDQTDLICRSRPGFIISFVNDAACHLLGRTRAELIGQDFRPYIYLDDLPALLEHYRAFSPEQTVQQIEHRVLDAEGKVRWIQWVNRTIYDEQGRLVEFQGVGRDITEQKHAKDALRAVVQGTAQGVGMEFLRNLTRHLAQVLGVRYAIVGELLPENTGRARTLALWAGRDFAENIEYDLRGTPCTDVYHHGACFHLSNVQELFPQAEILKMLNAQGYIGISFRDSGDRPLGHLVVMDDRPITEAPLAESLMTIFADRAATELERIRAEHLLADSARRKDEFLAMLAHELRNPLAPIRNAVQILQTVGSDKPLVQRQHAIIDRQVNHMARLLDDLLDVSRITRGKVELKHDTLALADVLAQAIETASPLIESREQTLTVDLPPAGLRVEGDVDRLVQVFGNLLTNAAKYTDKDGRIWLEAGRPEDLTAVIRVRDTGMGISPDLLPHIFELFTQDVRSLDRAQGGLGIGLTMVHQLVQMHGGRIEAHSEGAGKGSEFVVYLPALPEAQAAEVCPVALGTPDHGGKARRILVVDDIVDSARSLTELLTLWGHEVHLAYSGHSALEEVSTFQPEIVLLDIGLPDMDGYEVARRLRGEPAGRAALLVALTGYGQDEDRQMARAGGFDAFWVKPVDPSALGEFLAGRMAA